jgi:hypothetical protein
MASSAKASAFGSALKWRPSKTLSTLTTPPCYGGAVEAARPAEKPAELEKRLIDVKPAKLLTGLDARP